MKFEPYVHFGKLVQDCTSCNGTGEVSDFSSGNGYSPDITGLPENPNFVYERKKSCWQCSGKGHKVLKEARELEAEEREKREKAEERKQKARAITSGDKPNTANQSSAVSASIANSSPFSNIGAVIGSLCLMSLAMNFEKAHSSPSTSEEYWAFGAISAILCGKFWPGFRDPGFIAL
jgi:hypothetical protein